MWISRSQKPEALVAHRDNGGPAAGVGFAGGLGLRLQECNLCVSRVARHTRARRLIAAVDGRSKAAARLRLPFDKKNQRGKKKTHGAAHYPGFRGSLLGETAHGSRPCR